MESSFNIVKRALDLAGVPYKIQNLIHPIEKVIVLHGQFTNQVMIIFDEGGEFKKIK